MTGQISKLEECIGYSFHDRSLIVKALTHTSYANEKSRSMSGRKATKGWNFWEIRC